MEHTIEKLKNQISFVEDKKTITMNGYAFIDKCGNCIIIVYGEGRRDSMSKYLSGNTDELHIKYSIIDLTHK
jgi:6-phosphogluconolactonase/glucosamine-6-phosphate isomerase/deaminase